MDRYQRRKEYHRQYAYENRERISKHKKKYNKRKKEELFNTVIDGYGGKCFLCGLEDKMVLLLHHKDGGGTKHRKEVGKNNLAFYKWVINNKFPKWIEVLCANCHLRFHRKESNNN